MTKEKAKHLAEIFNAYAEGKPIEVFLAREWCEITSDGFNFDVENDSYRIKKEPKYRPFKTKEECWDEMHKHPDFGWVKFCNSICFIQNISFNKITVISDEEICSTSFEGGFTNMKFADGTPFGIKE